jgi:hypothetical protein
MPAPKPVFPLFIKVAAYQSAKAEEVGYSPQRCLYCVTGV